jgi:hypothetical protein
MPINRLLKNKRTPEEIEPLKQSLQPRSRRGRRKPIIPIIAASNVGSILKLYLHGADGMVHAPFRPEASAFKFPLNYTRKR